jgi:hypothetical protein
MKPLNRPMFRYGGPIKEGVMSGIREPKKNGGMLLVGQHPDRFKDASGREKHVAPIVYGAGVGLMNAARALPAIYRGFKGARMFAPGNLGFKGRMKDIFLGGGRFRQGQIPSQGNILTPAQIKAGMVPKIGQRGILESLKDPKSLGAAIAEYPVTALSALTLPNAALTVGPSIGKGALGAGKMFIDAVLPGEQFKKEIPEIDLEKNPNLGKTTKELGESKSTGTDSDGAPIVQLTDKEKRAQQIQKYRDIMDIKGMNKGAAYDSLIAASQAVNQAGGDLKGAIRDGSLINQIIQSTSKAFDKPAKTKDAIDTLILKGEIEKDINKDKNRLDAEYKRTMIDVNKKKLEGGDFSENVAISVKAGNSGQSAYDEAAKLTVDDFRGNLITKTDIDDVIKKKKKEGILDERDIVVSYTNTIIANANQEVPDGNYTVGKNLITIKDNKVFDIK